MEELGRSREHMKILPACFVVVGDTMEEARAKRAKLPRPKRRGRRRVQCCERSLAAYYDLARQVARLIQHVVHAAQMHSQQESVSFTRSFVR